MSESRNPFREMDLLRFTTAGSVDDGKSTLIGRLLYDTKSIFEDQLEAVERASRAGGEEEVNLALLTDGLRAEREQKITIDVAYRYFATPKRKFIIADTPGHIQYTRNMVTGASTAELAIVLIDARKGVLTQSKRHGFIASLLGIPHVLVAVNKMDLVGWSEATFDAIVDEYREFCEKLDIGDLSFIPLSALEGDNVVEPSSRMDWYQGPTLLHHLENVSIGAGRNLLDFRFPVQYVVRPHQDFRGFAGRVASGTLQPGEDVVVLPSGRRTRIRTIETADGPVAEAVSGDSVVLTTEDEVDISRGDMIVRAMNIPESATRFEAIMCWMSDEPLRPGREYQLLHTTRQVKARVPRLAYRINVDTLHRENAEQLGLNDIGRVRIETAQPIVFDPYRVNRQTGGFILVDPHTNATVGAGMIRGGVRSPPAEPGSRPRSPDVVWEAWNIPRPEREARNRHAPAVLWFTGLSGAGKSTVARAVERRLFDRGLRTMYLDGDQVRHGLCGDLGFSAEDRSENIRRVGEVARLFYEHGEIVLCAFVSPYREDRERVRALFPEGAFLEIHVEVGLEEARRRDPKGLYARADAGEIRGLTGVDAPYEAPSSPALTLDTETLDPDDAAERVLALLDERGITARD
jgi:bifunctional enzyme CysN/CysC